MIRDRIDGEWLQYYQVNKPVSESNKLDDKTSIHGKKPNRSCTNTTHRDCLQTNPIIISVCIIRQMPTVTDDSGIKSMQTGQSHHMNM